MLFFHTIIQTCRKITNINKKTHFQKKKIIIIHELCKPALLQCDPAVFFFFVCFVFTPNKAQFHLDVRGYYLGQNLQRYLVGS